MLKKFPFRHLKAITSNSVCLKTHKATTTLYYIDKSFQADSIFPHFKAYTDIIEIRSDHIDIINTGLDST